MWKLDFVVELYERQREPYPRTGLRLYPSLKRYELANKSALENFVYLNKDVYCGLFSNYQKVEREYDMLFLDIDSHDLHLSYFQLDIVRERLEQNGIKYYAMMFSGSKGFHVYVPFKPTRLVNFRNAVLGWLRHIEIMDFIDATAIEPNRVTRIPFTINSKSGLYCVPMGDQSTKFSLQQALTYAKEGWSQECSYIPNEDLGFTLKTFDSEATLGVGSGVIEGTTSKIFATENTYPPCMQRLVTMANDINGETGHSVPLNHDERLQMAIFLLHVFGGDIDKVAKYYENFDDYRESVTKYQIGYAKKRKLKMMSCDNLTDVGVCCVSHDVCPFYPSINHLIDAERKKQVSINAI